MHKVENIVVMEELQVHFNYYQCFAFLYVPSVCACVRGLLWFNQFMCQDNTHTSIIVHNNGKKHWFVHKRQTH